MSYITSFDVEKPLPVAGPRRDEKGTFEMSTYPSRSGTIRSSRSQYARTDSPQTSTYEPPPKPVLQRAPTSQTRYVDMLLQLDDIPRFHNILAAFSTWILLAGFVVFPGTFTTIQKSAAVNQKAQDNAVAHAFLDTVKHSSLVWVASACCVIGAAGMIGLWWRWRRNYVWVINRIFLPGCLNGCLGLTSTLINVFTAQNGLFSLTAKITVIVTGSCMIVTATLFFVYNNWALDRVREGHQREMGTYKSAGKRESVVEKVHRKAREPALEPGSVV